MTDAARETDDPPVEVEHVVAMLRERLYGAISCLATLAILARYSDEETDALARILDISVATGGLWAASLLSHFVAQWPCSEAHRAGGTGFSSCRRQVRSCGPPSRR